MDNISNVGPKNLYDVTLDSIVIDNQEDDLHDLSKSVHIYTKERMIKEKALYISKYEDAIIEDFYKSRDIRVYKDYAPCLRSERIGLKVVYFYP